MASGGLTKELLKEAVYKAIRKVRTAEQTAFEHAEWLQEFGNTNKFSLIGFVKHFSEQHHLSDSEKVLLRDSLRESLFMKDKRHSDTGSSNKPSENVVSAEAMTFVTLVKLLLSKSAKQGVKHGDLITTLSDQLEATLIPVNSQSEFLGWCLRQSGTGVQRIGTVEEMSIIVHCIYNTLCEVIGPVEADSILGTAVDNVKSLPCAVDFSPDNFL